MAGRQPTGCAIGNTTKSDLAIPKQRAYAIAQLIGMDAKTRVYRPERRH
jgi:hypothetical protein